MSEKLPEKSEKFMSAVAEASFRLRRIAEPRPVGDTIKAAINRAARAVTRYLHEAGHNGMSYGRAEDLWRREARRVLSEEMDAIRQADRAAARLVEEAKHAFREHDARIARLEALLVQDAHYYGPLVAPHIAALGGVDRAVDGAGLTSDDAPPKGEGG